LNGEGGTALTGEYAKGDTATCFVLPDSKKVDIATQEKPFFDNALRKAISQKGDGVYLNFKIGAIEQREVDGGKYAIVQFKYVLITGAGVEVSRTATASVTSTGKEVQLLWVTTISARAKKVKNDLDDIVGSFRGYGDGIKSDVADETWKPQV